MSSSSCRALREQREHFYTTRTKISHYTHYTQGEFSHRVKETLQLYVELCTTKNERILHTRNRNTFASRKDAIVHVTTGSSRKRKTANTLPTAPSTVL